MNSVRKTRLLALLLAVAMIVGMLPMGVLATDGEQGSEPEVTEYVVTFDSNGGSAVEPQTVAEGGLVEKPEDPTLEGQTFTGWFLEETAWDFETNTVSGDITLVAQWEETVPAEQDEETPDEGSETPDEVTASYTVKHYQQNVDGDGHTEAEVETKEGTVGQLTAAEAKAYTGFAAGEVTQLTIEAEGTVVEIYYARETYTVTFDTLGGSTVEAQTVRFGAKAAAPADPTLEGYTFKGWNAGETAYDFETEVTAPLTLTAVWEAVAVPAEEEGGYTGGLQLGQQECDYYNLIESSSWTLAPGATEYQYIINNDDGTRRQVVHVIEVDTKNPNVSVMPSSKGISPDVDYSNPDSWGIQGVTTQAKHVEENLGKNVIGGMNVSLSWSFTHPYGLLMYEGKVLHDSRASCASCGTGHPGGGYLVIKKDGTAEIRDAMAPIEEDDWMAQTVCFSYIVKDGKNVNAAESHTGGDPRSVIGIKADGTLVLMMVDGRMAPYSDGFTPHEMADIMISLGCVTAINCDGGGSSTFITEREGSGELTVKSRFSDGSERPTISCILVLSNVAPSGVFDHAAVETDVKLVTPYSEVTFTAAGVDAAGGPADLPEEGLTWQMKDDSMGTVEDGVFTSSGKTGTAVVQLVYEGNVVGEASVQVVIPDSISFVQENMVAPYGKSITLDVIAKYGMTEVTLKPEDLAYSMDVNTLGTISGMTFTATDDASVTDKAVVTVTLVHNEAVTDTANLSLGRASEIVYDFEGGAEDVASWTRSYKSPYTPDKYYFEDTFEVVSREDGGMVRNGDYALRVHSSGNSITCMNWCQTRFDGLAIDLTDAVSLSFWMYIPEGSHGLEWDIGSAIPIVLGHEFTYGTGWQYFTVPVSEIGTNVTSRDRFQLYHSDTNNTAIGYKHDEHPNYYADVTYYIDDITVNYSTAVDDNDVPVISNAGLSHSGLDTPVALQGTTQAANTVTLTAKATDNVALDPSSAMVYVDGVYVGGSCSDTGIISSGDITLANGTHVARFEISDRAGNTSTFFEYYFTLNGSSEQPTIRYEAHDPELENVPQGSLVWMDLVADSVDTVSSVSAILDLDQNSTWELDHAEVLEGFQLTYSVHLENNDATITIKRTGAVSATGEAVLVSIPVRVWTPEYATDGGNEDSHSYRLVSVMTHVEKGLLTNTDSTTVLFGSEEIVTSTEWNSTRLTSTADKASWHIHDAKPVEDVPADCTHDGVTGRTFCAGCNSVVVWGTVTEAAGHEWKLVDGIASCENCDVDASKMTGFIETAEGWAYLLEGKAATGWISMEDGWHWFNSKGIAPKGDTKVDGRDFRFEGEQGLAIGAWEFDGEGWKYYFCHRFYKQRWATIDGEEYYFDYLGHRQSGITAIGTSAYEFAEDGKLVAPMNGVFYLPKDGYYAYAIDGAMQYDTGLIEWEGDYYFVRPNARLITWPTTIPADKTNGLLPAGNYSFGEDAKMILRNGVCEDDYGKLVYFKDGAQQYDTGLVEWEGDYYFVRNNGLLITWPTYISEEKTNGLLPAGDYTFGADAKMVMKNGVAPDQFGKLCYYINGAQQLDTGLVEWEGDYYYVRPNGLLITWPTYVSEAKANGLLPAGDYSFGADGKMIMRNGVCEDDFGKLCYYINGAQQLDTGLVQWEGDYYYVRPNGLLITWATYVSAEKANGLLPAGDYSFGADGKLILRNGVCEDDFGKLCYYINGAQQLDTGLVYWEGDYYYVRPNGLVITWPTYVAADKTNGLMPAGNYSFGEDGKMILRNGVAEDDYGKLCYYVNGVQQFDTGLVEWEGDYYYVRPNGLLILWGTYVSEEKANGLLPAGNYEFGADGKMIQ